MRKLLAGVLALVAVLAIATAAPSQTIVGPAALPTPNSSPTASDVIVGAHGAQGTVSFALSSIAKPSLLNCVSAAECTVALSQTLHLTGAFQVDGNMTAGAGGVSLASTYGGYLGVGTYANDNSGVLSWANSTGLTGIQSNSGVTVNGVASTAFDLYRQYSGGSTALETMDTSGDVGLAGTLNASGVATSALTAKAVPPTSGSTIAMFGDSITYGYDATSCVSGGTSGSGGANYKKSVAPGSLTGTCWADKVGAYYGANVINIGLPSSRLQHCATSANCAGVASGIDRYTTDLIPNLSGLNSNGWVFFMYGTNDASVMGADSNFSASGFLADIKTIVAACETAGIPQSHIWLLSTAEDIRNTGPQAFSEAYNAQTQRAAQDLGVGYVDVFSSMAFQGGASIVNSGDRVHPSDAGYAVIASTIEQAAGLGHTLTGSFNGEGVSQLIPVQSEGLNITNCGSYPAYAVALSGNTIIGCDGNNLLLRTPTAGGNIAVQNPSGASLGVFDPAGDFDGGLGAASSTTVNSHVGFFSSGAAKWGIKLQYDGANFASGSFEPTGYDGWAWDTYTSGTYPTAESGFTAVARMDTNGDFFGGSFDVANACTTTGYAMGVFGHPILGCDATNLDLLPPAAGGSILLKNSVGTVQATSYSDGSFFSGANQTNTNSQALNPTLGFFNGGLGTNYWGTTLYHDGTNFSGGSIEPAGYDGWYWLTYPAGTMPTTQAGLTSRAHLDASGNFSANSFTAAGSPGIALNNGTSNLISFNGSGLAAPTFTTVSAGEKIQLYPAESGSQTDYGIGVNNSVFWMGVPISTSSFLWYAGTTNIATLSGTGIYSVSAQMKAATVAAGTQSYVAPVYTSAGAATAATVHHVTWSCTFAAATTCAVTLTGTSTGKFTSATSYACPAPDMGTATTYIGFVVGNKSTTGFTVYASASNSDTVNGICTGT